MCTTYVNKPCFSLLLFFSCAFNFQGPSHRSEDGREKGLVFPLQIQILVEPESLFLTSSQVMLMPLGRRAHFGIVRIQTVGGRLRHSTARPSGFPKHALISVTKVNLRAHLNL